MAVRVKGIEKARAGGGRGTGVNSALSQGAMLCIRSGVGVSPLSFAFLHEYLSIYILPSLRFHLSLHGVDHMHVVYHPLLMDNSPC